MGEDRYPEYISVWMQYWNACADLKTVKQASENIQYLRKLIMYVDNTATEACLNFRIRNENEMKFVFLMKKIIFSV